MGVYFFNRNLARKAIKLVKGLLRSVVEERGKLILTIRKLIDDKLRLRDCARDDYAAKRKVKW